MVRVISQETYNEAIKENMEEFGMSLQDAIADAITQFQAQGVDLTNIIKYTETSDDPSSDSIISAIRYLNELVQNYTYASDKQIICNFNVLVSECKKGIAHQMRAGKEKAYDAIILSIKACTSNDEVVIAGLETLIALMDRQPDLLNEEGIILIISFLTEPKNSVIKNLVLRWALLCCIKHEMNRQGIFKADILQCLKKLLAKSDKEMLKNICALLRALCLDDDIRVEFGQAHEHARAIATDTLCAITALLEKFHTDEEVVSELMLTLAAITVRNEFCQKIVECGGLQFILDSMVEFAENYRVVRQGFKLLKALAGNDEVKLQIIKDGGDSIIAGSLDGHKTNEGTVVAGLACISAITLRAPTNSKALYNNAVPQIIANCMELHKNSVHVQKMASWAIRNMVVRSRDQCDTFKKYGVEKYLNQAIKQFPDCEYDFKAALRDLGCDVNLREEWTGKGGKLNTSENLLKDAKEQN